MANLKFDNVDVTNAGDWGNRQAGLFIDTMIKSAAVLDRFTIVDGVKDKLNVPVFALSQQQSGDPAVDIGFGTGANCDFTDTWSADITEKEMSVTSFSWGFKNCKDALESSYRSLMLKKGQLNPETLDAEFRGWIFDRFAKVAAEKALLLAGSELIDLMDGTVTGDAVVADQTVVVDTDGTAGDLQLSSAVLDILEKAYLHMSSEMASAVYGDADREFKPAIFLGTVAYQSFQIAMAEDFATSMTLSSSDGIAEGRIPTYYGIEVIHLASLAANKLFITAPSNLVMLTDDYNDVAAIDSEYEAKENAEYLWGRFKLGFSYLKGSEIVLGQQIA